jgi:hypothetical protein
VDGRTRNGTGSEPKGSVQKTGTYSEGDLNTEAAGFSGNVATSLPNCVPKHATIEQLS